MPAKILAAAVIIVKRFGKSMGAMGLLFFLDEKRSQLMACFWRTIAFRLVVNVALCILKHLISFGFLIVRSYVVTPESIVLKIGKARSAETHNHQSARRPLPSHRNSARLT